MAGLAAGPVQPIYSKPMAGTSGYMGGGNPYNPSAQYGDTWGTVTGDAYQSTFTPKKNPQTGMLEGGSWSVNPAGRTLQGQEFDFNKQRWGDVLRQMQDVVGKFSSSGGGSLGAEIAPPVLPGRSSGINWTPDAGVASQAFARSKENVGRMASAAERELGDTMSARGLSGSGLAMKALAGLRGDALRALSQGEFERNAANEQRLFDAAKINAGIETGERAMDITGLNNIYATQVAQRGQQANDPRIQLLASLASSIGGMY